MGHGHHPWNFGAYHLSQQNISEQDAFFWAKVLQLGVIFMPISMFHLCLIISKTRVGWLLPVLYPAHACLATSLLFNWFIVGVRKLDVGYWSVPGPGFHVFTFFYLALTISLMCDLVSQAKRCAAHATDARCGRCCWPT